jgi:peptidoglycan/xylan/chitin deacetylase (PgdA/CDA1 family)
MKRKSLCVDRRRFVTGAVVSGAGALIGGIAHAVPNVMHLPFSLRGQITNGVQATVTRIETNQPNLALTFDDGPDRRHTPRLLDILAERGVKATFYVVGRAAAYSPHIIQRMVAEGHEIGNHSWSHPVMSGYSRNAIQKEILRTNQAVFDASGLVPKTFRPPYGAFQMHQRFALMQDLNMPTVLWSVDPEDWRYPGRQYITDFITRRSQPGSIVLTHDIHGPTVRSFLETLDNLIERGFNFVTISELVEI